MLFGAIEKADKVKEIIDNGCVRLIRSMTEKELAAFNITKNITPLKKRCFGYDVFNDYYAQRFNADFEQVVPILNQKRVQKAKRNLEMTCMSLCEKYRKMQAQLKTESLLDINKAEQEKFFCKLEAACKEIMAADIKEEFEDYVKKLTTAICKEIFLERMEELFTKHEEENTKFCEASKNVFVAGESLQEEVKIADTTVKKIEADTINTLQIISKDIVSMEDNIHMMFEEMRELNAESKHDFISELNSYISNYKKEVTETIDKGCEQISDKFASVSIRNKKEIIFYSKYDIG